MTVINRFMGLALFIASVAGVGATQRSLSDDAGIVMHTEGKDGELYTFTMFADETDIVTPDGVKFEINADGIRIITDEAEATINEDGTFDIVPTTMEADTGRRLQTDTCEDGYEICLLEAASGCAQLEVTCTQVLPLLEQLDGLAPFTGLELLMFEIIQDTCADFTFCSNVAFVAGCRDACPLPCNPSLNNADNTNEVCTGPGEICCPFLQECEVPDPTTGACGDPHMTGFRGQKFDFTGKDGQWYCMLEDGPSLHVNMRVTSPVPSLPEITYITGLSVITTDDEGIEHTIDISVTDPHSMDSTCSVGVSPCLADGALTVKLDGVTSLASPGEVTLGPSVAVSAVNLPGACRSFGYETYWERKKLENASAGRRLDVIGVMHEMGDWVLGDPTATNKLECTEYVAAAGATLGGLFAHNSEHASFQIVTPRASIRLSHGRLHQLPMRDPTDQFDLPEHLTWQMNVAIDQHDVSLDATGILGETVVPTVDDMGKPIMQGIHAIRGTQDDYRVAGPLEIEFAQGHHRE